MSDRREGNLVKQGFSNLGTCRVIYHEYFLS
jgi:hypothetical protein